MLVLGGIVLLLAGLLHSCSFSPGGPSVNTSELPSVDVGAEIQSDAGQLPFPLRQPAVPADWRASSAGQQQVGTTQSVVVLDIGWVTSAGDYVQLGQSNGTPTDLVAQIVGSTAAASIAPQGTVNAGGRTWTVYPGVRAEHTWVTDLGSVRLVITGNGTTAEFTTMAQAILAAPVVQPQGN